MTDRHYEIERTMTKPLAGGTVTPTTTGDSSRAYKYSEDDDDDGGGISCVSASRTESKSVQRKRRRTGPASPRTGIPRKSPRWTGEKEIPEQTPDEHASEDVPEELRDNVHNESMNISSFASFSSDTTDSAGNYKTESSNEAQKRDNSDEKAIGEEKNSRNRSFPEYESNSAVEEEREAETLSRKPPMHPDVPRRRLMGLAGTNRRDDSARLRKTIQWLEEGARKLREDLAETRAELHEERRASRLARREIEVAVREARAAATAKHQRVIAELKTRLSQSPSPSTTDLCPASTKAEFLKDENHRREISAAKKRLAEADATIRKLRSNSLDSVTGIGSGKRRKVEAPSSSEVRKLDCEIKALRTANKKLEEKLNMVCTEAEKIRTMELRIQYENHESELNALKKSLRSDTIRMMDEIRNKDREIERLGRLARESRKSRAKNDDTMRKLRENENGHQIRLAARIEDKIPQVKNVIDLCKSECEAVAEVERLRELAIEQQEFIEVLRQAVKEKERKLDQLSNKKRKEEFYKQWLELEPVAEVDDEEEHEEGDSALSSAPSSLSPQPGGCGHWQTNGVTREAYEAVLLEIDEIQTKFIEEQQELAHAKSQVRDLEKALLQETRGSQNSRRALSEKLRKIEEREASLIAEISELREQNELLEFRVLELEETPGSRETPDTVDSGVVSPEPINIFKQEQSNKQRDRAVATVLPFSSYTYPASPILVKKPPLSLQESGIFEDDEEEIEDEMEAEINCEIELTSCGTQTEAPVGELLQEVQRLQELRERIQERAVKVPANPTIEFTDSKIEEDKSFYREKIRELEERLAEKEEEDVKRIENNFVVKQREEDLLDENYRLTERVYWLENELRRIESEEKTFVDVETMTDEKHPLIDEETMTEAIQSLLNAETITKHEKHTSDVETMTELPFLLKESRKECAEINEKSCKASSADISSISRCEKIYRTVLQNNLGNTEVLKTSRMEIDGFKVEQNLLESRINEDTVEDCPVCVSLRRDYDEKISQLARAECRFRGRLVDLERKEGAFVHTLKQVDVTWSQLEADHAKKLEEIGRRLEEKVECNRRIMERVAKLEMLKYREEKKKPCSCKCNGTSLISDGISSLISSADVHQYGMQGVNSSGVDEADTAMDVDIENREGELGKVIKIMKEVNQTTRTDGNGFECPSYRTKGEEIWDENSKSLRRISVNDLSKKIVEMPTIDASTEIAIEAKEEIDDNSTSAEADGGVSRVHLLPEEERPAPEPTETRCVSINETELDKKEFNTNLVEGRDEEETIDEILKQSLKEDMEDIMSRLKKRIEKKMRKVTAVMSIHESVHWLGSWPQDWPKDNMAGAAWCAQVTTSDCTSCRTKYQVTSKQNYRNHSKTRNDYLARTFVLIGIKHDFLKNTFNSPSDEQM